MVAAPSFLEPVLLPAHDPDQRESVHDLGDWEIRVFTGPKFDYFAPRGCWHLQLWDPIARLSILTPSRLTRGLYEAFPSRGWRRRTRTYDALAAILGEEHGVEMPDPRDLAWAEETFVHMLLRPAD